MLNTSYPYLNDKKFLKEFDLEKLKEQDVRITVLNFDEKPISQIEGRTTGGNLSIDGSSSLRRSGNLNLFALNEENDLSDISNILSIRRKIKIEIGFLNTTEYYKSYEKIWFPMGIFVITGISFSHSLVGVDISMQIKDKMCLLNGDCGGVLPASITFHEIESVDVKGNTIIERPTIFQIIQELVNHWGGEQLRKIIINDIDLRVKQVMKWIGSSPLYIINTQDINTGQSGYIYTQDIEVAERYKEQSTATVEQYEFGDNLGYIYTDFIYPGELVSNVGETICSVLDKIRDALGNYEYYYDVEGNFIFQEIKNYLNTSHSTIEMDKINNGDYLIDRSGGKSVYEFDGSNLVTSYSNSPQLNMIKNDFVVWGLRKNATGATFPIRYHLAIDKKPEIGNTYKVFFWKDPTDGIKKAKVPISVGSLSDIQDINTEAFYQPIGQDKIYQWNPAQSVFVEVADGLKEVTTTDWRTELYLSGVIAEPIARERNYYYTELVNEWPKLYDVEEGHFYQEVLDHPEDIDFYLDFIDAPSKLSKISVSNIGRRSKAENNDKINCVFEPEIPDLVLIERDAEDTEKNRLECEANGQPYTQLPQIMFNQLAYGGGFNAAYDSVRGMLYQNTSYNESISISAIPIYHLEPNTRITVRDLMSGIYGDYMINSISVPFDISGTTTISCSRALERL